VVHESIAIGGLDGELVPDIVIAFVGSRENEVSVGEFAEVVVRDFFSGGVPFIEFGDF